MRSVEIVAKTVDEAVKQALEKLGLPPEKVNIEVIEEPNKGLFGVFGNKMAKIIVSEKEDPLTAVKQYLLDITKKMGITAHIVTEEEDEHIRMVIVGDDLGIIIGRRGETLDALQYLANLVASRNTAAKQCSDRKRIILDAEGYRKRREETLVKLANRLAEKVSRAGVEMSLEPMNPQERRIIHTALQDNKHVRTESKGQEPYRKVVIYPN